MVHLEMYCAIDSELHWLLGGIVLPKGVYMFFRISLGPRVLLVETLSCIVSVQSIMTWLVCP